MKTKLNKTVNTIVQIEGVDNGKDFFNAQFCPIEEDVYKAMRKFFEGFKPLMDYMGDSKIPQEDLEKIFKDCTKQKLPFNVEFNGNNWLRVKFEKL